MNTYSKKVCNKALKKDNFRFQICSASDEVRVFYSDSASFEQLIQMMKNTPVEELTADNPLRYHIELVRYKSLSQ